MNEVRRRSQYGVELRDKARELRRTRSDAEDRLWLFLRDRRLMPSKFRRQHPLGPFIVDFYCHEHRLAIELDGGQHYDPEGLAHDKRRTAFLSKRGVRVLRFSNLDVLENSESVVDVILRTLAELSPNPPPEGEGSGLET